MKSALADQDVHGLLGILQHTLNAHIAKPIDPQKLYETLAAYIK